MTIPVPDHCALGPSVEDILTLAAPRQALATPESWQEWLAGFTGREAWAGEERVPETNFMARAKPGEVTGCWVKSAARRDGLAVWEKWAHAEED